MEETILEKSWKTKSVLSSFTSLMIERILLFSWTRFCLSHWTKRQYNIQTGTHHTLIITFFLWTPMFLSSMPWFLWSQKVHNGSYESMLKEIIRVRIEICTWTSCLSAKNSSSTGRGSCVCVCVLVSIIYILIYVCEWRKKERELNWEYRPGTINNVGWECFRCILIKFNPYRCIHVETSCNHWKSKCTLRHVN